VSHFDQFSEENRLPNAYAQAYTPAGLTRSTRGLAIATFAVSVAYTGLLVATNLAAAPAIRDVERAGSTGVYDDTWATIYDGLAVAMLPSMILVWVMTCIWLGLARRNAEAISPDYIHRRRFGWLWAGWIVPIVNLWFPYQGVRDTYLASVQSRTFVPFGWALSGWWWASWLGVAFSNRLLDSLMSAQLDGGDLNPGPIQAVAAMGTGLTVVSLVLWGLVIRGIVLTQESRTAEGLRT
jgi:hypothetical protein